MSQLDDFREQLRLAKRDDADRHEAAASEPRKAFPQKTVRKKNVRSEPKCPDRTSLSLSRETSARLDCYKFWLRRPVGQTPILHFGLTGKHSIMKTSVHALLNPGVMGL